MIAVTRKVIKINKSWSEKNKKSVSVFLDPDYSFIHWKEDWPEPYQGMKVTIVIGEENE